MRKGFIAASLGLLAAAVSDAAIAKPRPATPAQLAACTNVSLGFLGPLTGPAAFLGQEQLSWLRFGAQKYNRPNGTRFKVAAGDTQLKAPVARTRRAAIRLQPERHGRHRRLGEPGRARQREPLREGATLRRSRARRPRST